MAKQPTGSAPEREPTRFARTILSMAIAQTQATLFDASEEDQGASQLFRARVLGVVEPLLLETGKLFSEALAPTASIDLRHRIEDHTSLIQITAVSNTEFDHESIQRLGAAAAAMAERLAGAMDAIASPLPFTRSAPNHGDRLFDQVAQVKKRGVPTAFSFAIQAGYIAGLGTLRFTEVHKRAKSTWLQDPEPNTPWIEAIIRSSRSGKQLSAAPLNGAPAFKVDTDAEDDPESDLTARAHALCGGSCWLNVRRSTEHCEKAPELERHVHHLVAVEIRDASQLKSLRRLHAATAGLIEQAEAFERAASQRASRKRPQDPPPGSRPAA